MNSKILCNWLGILDWPPDHYALLGLEPGERDAARIEQRVQERMAKLRCYQLSHPEEATEGMNRIAQAFICLTEALSRPTPPFSPEPAATAWPVEKARNGPAVQDTFSAASVDTQKLQPVAGKSDTDWKNTPPPVRVVMDFKRPPEVAQSASAANRLDAQVAAPAPVSEPVDLVIQLAQQSTEARRGLGTLPALIERIHLTRKLILAWNQAGKYLSNPEKRLTRSAEEADLTRRLNRVFELTGDFPKIVGHPGQPGYRVVAMARLEMTAQMFKMLDKTQRSHLARDWNAGYSVLLSHRRFLRSQFKLLRSRGLFSLVLEAIRGALNDHPVWVSTGVLLAAVVCVFLYRKMFF